MPKTCKRGHVLSADNVYIPPSGSSRCRKCLKENDHKYRQKNCDMLSDYHKKYRNINKYQIREKGRKRYYQNPEAKLERNRKYKLENPEKMREIRRRYYAKTRNSIGNYKPWMIRYYRYAQDGRCFYCSNLMLQNVSRFNDQKETLEHMLPISREGLHSWENTILACWGCNRKKQNKTVSEFCKQPTCV